MSIALTTEAGINQKTSEQLQKAAVEILYSIRLMPTDQRTEVLGKKMELYVAYWTPWLSFTVDRVTPEFTFHCTVRKRKL